MDSKTRSENVYLKESSIAHVEVTHKSENGLMNSVRNPLYRYTERKKEKGKGREK
jgi:stalled ribosome alternative rescue factor ArfA